MEDDPTLRLPSEMSDKYSKPVPKQKARPNELEEISYDYARHHQATLSQISKTTRGNKQISEMSNSLSKSSISIKDRLRKYKQRMDKLDKF